MGMRSFFASRFIASVASFTSTYGAFALFISGSTSWR